MTLQVRDPWQMLDLWRREVDPWLANIKDDDTQVLGSRWAPAVDIREEPDRYLLHADIPGVKAEDIEISMENGILTIRGERRHEMEESAQGVHRRERQQGVFMRRFTLPDTIDAEAIEATSREGVLEVSLPKSATQQPRKIEVRS